MSTTEENIIAVTAPGQEVKVVVASNPGIILTDETWRTKLFAFLEAEIAAHVPDLATEKGRKAITANSASISKMKVAIEKAGDALKADAQKTIKNVNAVWKDVEVKMEELRDLARKPLTDWEQAEAERVKYVADLSAMLQFAPRLLATDDSASAGAILAKVEALEIDPAMAGESLTMLAQMRIGAITSLGESVARLKRQELEAAELAELRAKQAIRDAEDAERARIAEAARIEAERVEMQRIAEEKRKADEEARAKAEAERTAAALKAAAEKAERDAAEREAKLKRDAEAREAMLIKEAEERERRERIEAQKREQAAIADAERKAKEEQDRKDREHAEELRKLQVAADFIASERERERREAEGRAAQIEKARIAAADLIAAKVVEESVRQTWIGEAEDALREGGVSGMQAKRAMALIAAGKVAHVRLG